MNRYIKGKIHGVRVTKSLLRYHGSVTVDRELMEKAGIEPYEAVDVVNLNTGDRWSTYILPGGKGEFWLNGGSARLGTLGDECLLMVYGFGDKFPGAKVVMVNEKNEIIDLIDYK